MLPQPEIYDWLFSGEAATTGPSSGFMSLPRGVRTYSLYKSLNPVIRSADMCVASLHQPPQLYQISNFQSKIKNIPRIPRCKKTK